MKKALIVFPILMIAVSGFAQLADEAKNVSGDTYTTREEVDPQIGAVSSRLDDVESATNFAAYLDRDADFTGALQVNSDGSRHPRDVLCRDKG